MMLDQELDDGSEVVCNDAPSDPTFHADFAASQAAIQMPGASELADASFDPVTEGLCSAKPGLVFVVAARVRLIPGLRQADALHAQEACPLFVGGRVNAAIATDFFGWFAKEQAVMAQAGEQQRCFMGIALQETILAYQPALDLRIPNFAAELRLFGFGFAAPDQGRMGFKQAQHLLAGGSRFAMQDSCLGLGNDLLDQRQIVLQTFIQSIGRRVVQLCQAGLDLSHLLQQSLYHRQQLLYCLPTSTPRAVYLHRTPLPDLGVC
jgi:hypothetical protein